MTESDAYREPPVPELWAKTMERIARYLKTQETS